MTRSALGEVLWPSAPVGFTVAARRVVYCKQHHRRTGGFNAPAGYGRIGATDQAVRGTARISTTDWTHLAMTYDGSVQRLYVNGVLAGTHAQTGNMAVGNQPLRIGGNGSFPGEFFKGLIDEVKVYNRALTAAEILAEMSGSSQ